MNTFDIRDIPIFWINLDRQPERRERMESFFKKNEFTNTTRVPGVVHDRGARGCGLAFMKVFQEVAPTENFIILEDDCLPTEWYDPIIEIPEDTDAYYLGISAWARKNGQSGPLLEIAEAEKNTYRILNMLSGHAIYYKSKKYVDHCKKWCEDYDNETEDNFDIGIAERMSSYNVYCSTTPIFYQTTQSHVTNVMINRVQQ